MKISTQKEEQTWGISRNTVYSLCNIACIVSFLLLIPYQVSIWRVKRNVWKSWKCRHYTYIQTNITLVFLVSVFMFNALTWTCICKLDTWNQLFHFVGNIEILLWNICFGVLICLWFLNMFVHVYSVSCMYDLFYSFAFFASNLFVLIIFP